MFFLNNLTGALTPTLDMKRYVTQDELVGVWIHTSGTERIIAQDKPSGVKPSKCHIILYQDGTCEFDSVYDNFSSLEYFKFSNRWTLEHDTMGNSNIRKKNAISFDINERGFAGKMYLNLKEEDGKLILWEWYGDPDSGEMIEYKKEEIKNNQQFTQEKNMSS
jgi:hypothetical protein